MASPDWWSELWGGLPDWLKDWIEDINAWVGTLTDLYEELEEAGLLTSEERMQAELEGWTKEDLIHFITIREIPAWQIYLPWIIVGGLGIGLILALTLKK